MIDKKNLSDNFSKNAENYDEYANVQKKMGDVLIDFTIEDFDLSKVKNILEIGCGTGYLTKALVEKFPNAKIDGVDIAPGMILRIKSKFENTNLNFICEDIEEVELEKKYDLIISNATFQWFNSMEKTLKKLYEALTHNGVICYSTFGNYTFNELHTCFDRVKKSENIEDDVKAGQSFNTIDDLRSLSEKTTGSSEEIKIKDILEYEYFNTCKDFLYSVKKIGASNSNKGNRCTSPSFIKKVMKLYDEEYLEGNKVRATYHCLFHKMCKN